MKTLLSVILTIATSVTFAQTRAKAAVTKNVKPAPMVAAAATMDVTGEVKWTGYGVGKSHHGKIPLNGQIEMKGDELVGGTFVLDMTNITTADSERLQGHLRSADFFDVEKYKEGTFKFTKVEALKPAKAGDPTHKITGDLTIKTKTNSEIFMAVVSKKDKKYMAIAMTQIADRTKYDIVFHSGKFTPITTLGDKLIEDKIDVQLDVQTK